MTSASGFSSIFEQGTLKPGVYKIQNIHTENYLDILSLASMELCCRPEKNLGVGRGLWQILKLGDGYAVRRVDQENPSQFCGPLHGLNDRAGIYITAYPSAWKIELANQDKYHGFEYVRFLWATTKMTWDLWAGKNSDGAPVKLHPSSSNAWQVWRLIPEEVKGTTTSFSKLSEFWPPPAHGGVTKPPPSYNDCPYGCTPINSAVRSVPGTVLSVVAPETNSRRLIHQALNGTLKQRLAAPGANLGANPGYLTPLATLSWDGGNQVRVYYLDRNFVIRDHCLTNGSWSTGKLADELDNIKAAPGAGLAATLLPNKTSTRIHVYYQAIDLQTQERIIRQLIFDGASWRKGKLDIGGSLADTSLSAVAYYYGGQDHTRVFYQAKDLSLKDHLFTDESGWKIGDFNPGQATARTPISAITFAPVEVQVYWRDLAGRVVFSRKKKSEAWGGANIVMEARATYRFSAMQWSDGERLRVCYQDFAGTLLERRSDDCGDTWQDGGPAL